MSDAEGREGSESLASKYDRLKSVLKGTQRERDEARAQRDESTKRLDRCIDALTWISAYTSERPVMYEAMDAIAGKEQHPSVKNRFVGPRVPNKGHDDE